MNSDNLKINVSPAVIAAIVYAACAVIAVELTPHREVVLTPLLLNAATFGAAMFLIAFVIGGISRKMNRD